MTLIFEIYVGLQLIAMSSNYIIDNCAAVIRKGGCAYSIGKSDDNWEEVNRRVHHSVYDDLTEFALELYRIILSSPHYDISAS